MLQGPLVETLVEEFTAVVAVDMVDMKRELGVDPIECLNDSFGCLVFDGPVYRPSGEDIGDGEHVGEFAPERVSAVRDGVHGNEPRLLIEHRDLGQHENQLGKPGSV